MVVLYLENKKMEKVKQPDSKIFDFQVAWKRPRTQNIQNTQPSLLQN